MCQGAGKSKKCPAYRYPAQFLPQRAPLNRAGCWRAYLGHGLQVVGEPGPIPEDNLGPSPAQGTPLGGNSILHPPLLKETFRAAELMLKRYYFN